MKKNYLKPTTVMVEIQQKSLLLVDSVKNNANLYLGGSKNVSARSRQASFNSDDDEWE